MKDEILKKIEDVNFLDRGIVNLENCYSKEIINELIESGLVISKDNQLFLPQQLDLLVGRLTVNKKGFGFVIIGNEKDDVFVAKDNLKNAYQDDIVSLKVKNSDGNRVEGEIVSIIKRGKRKLVGELKQGKKDYYIESTIPGLDKHIFIDKAHSHGAMPGHQVVVEIKTYKPTVKGAVLEVLGHRSDPGIDILSIVRDHDVDVEFSEQVYKHLELFGDEINQEDTLARVDLRDELIVTIDGDDAKDLDDAISLKKLDNGNYYLGVHIADVSHYVSENSVIDNEAISRGTSIYLVDRVIPMLPHKLSNGLCSLHPHVDRLTISCYMEINNKGKVVDHKIIPSVINSNERMTYNNVNKILDGDIELNREYSDIKDLFYLMDELAKILKLVRDEQGAIDFDVKEAKILVDAKGKPYDVVLRQRGTSDKIIEEFMLLANETVAEHFARKELPFIYRIHENPKTSKLQQFTQTATLLGYKLEGGLDDLTPKQLSDLLESSKGTPEHEIIATLLLRCMQKARYDEHCLGHYGLANQYYTHFTSPIRRYPDLIVHRLIRRYLFDLEVNDESIAYVSSIMPDIAIQTSNLERRAITVERDVEDMKKAEFMESSIGKRFTGTISSITGFGFFVALDNTIEGLVHITELTDDYYFYDEKNVRYVGRRSGKKFRMSDTVEITVLSASKKDKTVDFGIVGMKRSSPKKPTNYYKKDDKKTYNKNSVKKNGVNNKRNRGK